MQQAALPFITHSPSQGYTIHPQAIHVLQQLHPQNHCSVIAIVGKAKTGKSYLFNQLTPLLQGQTSQPQQYFPVFNGIGTGTTGVTMMPVNVDGHIVIMLDMEGLGSLTNSSTNEGKLFALTLLLSSVMMYNNVGPLDHQALQGLGILA